MFYFHFVILSNYSKDPTDRDLEEQENKEIHFNYQGQDRYQHLTLNLG